VSNNKTNLHKNWGGGGVEKGEERVDRERGGVEEEARGGGGRAMHPRSDYYQSLSPFNEWKGGSHDPIGGERGFREEGGEGDDG
jgi:hypothetical protein